MSSNQIRFVPPQAPPALEQLSDDELVALCKLQLPDEIVAYRELVRRYESLVYNFCLKTIGSPQDAEEVAQDALIQVFHKIHQFEGRSAFKTWLYKIVHNYCRTRISKIVRKRQVQEAYEDHVKKEAPAHGKSNPHKTESAARIQEALHHLKPKDKEIITYKFMLGMTLQEISDTLGLGASAAKMRYYRAMEAFKAAYERAGADAPTPLTPHS
ncbi:sigma-70 family RNA polymerase sigma factor [Pelagicoccus sp. SDUM812005]|uniref:sigma-70 family RNA polymerase sigma factor n=1 Tax=Pelagicoccus sp. SDUM812005 TaxID=3041257 RepID=UPI00280F4BEA|nr:sigma-70 family RNA polymerase sigma factor [Pelagicoccus sp. SDUM812005]MDQ8181975.1 sigma-70 family RNA polymerase sigma factor [Pelagicoccus sp. SDUM812005]